MFMWILKMLLKMMKPFAKVAILNALLETFTDGEEEESILPVDDEDEGVE